MFPKYCGSRDESDSSATLTRTKVDFYETSCSIRHVSQTAQNRWRVSGQCDAEGEKMPGSYDLTVNGDRMTMRDASGGPVRTYQRCN
jgi:hypothetical protein